MELKYKVYVENNECKYFVYPDSPYDWSKEPGILVETDFTPEMHGLHELAYESATGSIILKP